MKKWTALDLTGISRVVDVDVPVYSKVEGILSADAKKTAPKVEQAAYKKSEHDSGTFVWKKTAVAVYFKQNCLLTVTIRCV
jgi:hypothetical protein